MKISIETASAVANAKNVLRSKCKNGPNGVECCPWKAFQSGLMYASKA